MYSQEYGWPKPKESDRQKEAIRNDIPIWAIKLIIITNKTRKYPKVG